MSRRDRLIVAELGTSLGESVIGRRIIILASTRSTNDFLLQMLTPELPEGCVVFAEEQTAGRGQRGNRWESASHLGLWCSVLLRPRLALAESGRLTDWAAQAVAATVARETGLEPVIKPPNDVCVSGRKIAGVLVDTRNERDRIDAAIVGIGINLNQALEDFPVELRERAGSLAMISGAQVNRTIFAAALLQELERTRMSLDDHPASDDAPLARSSGRSPRASADKSVAKSPMA
jgi:BirA family biotin operon repressor/biotin-[acetyl-CoA-carboxylase] ligase